MILTTVIIDDELDAIATLSNFIRKYCEEVEVVGKASSLDEGLKLIQIARPTFLLLDIQLQDGTGFDLLEKLLPIETKVIFTTAYEQYAVRAFRYHAIDYLLKPINPEHLIEAIQKIKASSPMSAQRIQYLSTGLLARDLETIALPGIDEYQMIQLKDINWCEADGNYTKVMVEGRQYPIVVTSAIKEYEEILPHELFFRVHQSYLVNLRKVAKYVKTDGGYLLMKNGTTIPVARRKRTAFLQRLKVK
ncbi:MAG: LytR/AlgR family response regulator transcription factor [Flammeovirgaceae bacterium]